MKSKYCYCCGARLQENGKSIKGNYEITKGFIEIGFMRDGYVNGKSRENNCGYVKILTDNDMGWVFPVKDVVTKHQVLYQGLSDFLDMLTEERSAIHLYCDELEGVNCILGKETPIIPHDKTLCSGVKYRLKRRPYIILEHLQSRLLTEKMKFLKARFIKGQKGKGLPNHNPHQK